MQAAETAVRDAENMLTIFAPDTLPFRTLLDLVKQLPNRMK
jgi:hypothetical protein